MQKREDVAHLYMGSVSILDGVNVYDPTAKWWNVHVFARSQGRSLVYINKFLTALSRRKHISRFLHMGKAIIRPRIKIVSPTSERVYAKAISVLFAKRGELHSILNPLDVTMSHSKCV